MKTKWTSSILIFLAVFLLIFAGCEQPGTETPESDPAPEQKTQLVIKNQSTSFLDVSWNGRNFGDLSYGLAPGEHDSNTVEEGSSYVYITETFKSCRTSASVFVEKGKTVTFTITDNTIVIYNGRSMALKDLQ